MASWLYIYSSVREIILWKGCLAADLDSLARDKTLWLSMWCFSCHGLKELSGVTSILEHSLTWLQVHINCKAHFQVYQRINQLKSKYFGLVGCGSYCTSVHASSNGLSLLTDFFFELPTEILTSYFSITRQNNDHVRYFETLRSPVWFKYWLSSWLLLVAFNFLTFN